MITLLKKNKKRIITFDKNKKFKSKFNENFKKLELNTIKEEKDDIDSSSEENSNNKVIKINQMMKKLFFSQRRNLLDFFNLNHDVNLTLIDSIIDSYSSEKDYENYESNLVLEIELEGTEGIEKIDSFCKHNSSNKRSLVGDILGFGETNIEGSKTKPYTKTDKVTIYEKDETMILRNKFKFFAGIMFLAKEEISKISKDEIKEKLDEGRCMEIFYASLKNIAPKLTYIFPAGDDKEKLKKHNEGLKKFINFFW